MSGFEWNDTIQKLHSHDIKSGPIAVVAGYSELEHDLAILINAMYDINRWSDGWSDANFISYQMIYLMGGEVND